MNDAVGSPLNVEPTEWYLVFLRARERTWFGGEFRHVSAVSEINGIWLLYDVTTYRTRVCAFPGSAADKLLAAIEHDSEIVLMPARKGPPTWRRPGFWCVPAMAHLVGIKTHALRPDAFFRDCLANGGTRIGDATEPSEPWAGGGTREEGPAEVGPGTAVA